MPANITHCDKNLTMQSNQNMFVEGSVNSRKGSRQEMDAKRNISTKILSKSTNSKWFLIKKGTKHNNVNDANRIEQDM